MNIQQLRQMSARTALNRLGEEVRVTFCNFGLYPLKAVLQYEAIQQFKDGSMVNTHAIWFAFEECDFQRVPLPTRSEIITYGNKNYRVEEVVNSNSGIVRIRVHETENSRTGIAF